MGLIAHSKKVLLVVAALIVTASSSVFLLPAPTAKAASAEWVNRTTIKYTDDAGVVDYFTDGDSYDENFTFVGTKREGSCAAQRLVFNYTDIDFLPEWMVDYPANIFFYYYTSRGWGFNLPPNTASYFKPTPITSGPSAGSCTEQAASLTVAKSENRRILYVRDAGSSTISHVINRNTYTRNGEAFGHPRFISGDTDACKDTIILWEADPLGDDFFGTDPMPGSAMLFSGRDNGNDFERKSESFQNILAPFPNQITCGINDDDVLGAASKHGLVDGDTTSDSVNPTDNENYLGQLFASGINGGGVRQTNGNMDDDSYIIFTGTVAENTIPADFTGTPGGDNACPVPGLTNLPRTDPDCVAADQPICTTGDGLAGAIAWIVCPLIDFLARGTKFVEMNFILPFLSVNPLTVGDYVYSLWDSFRSVANVLFIIAFFIIIFSQATSLGVSNYGIKRTLPRLIIVAIGTNLSFFIAAFMIDMFNIFGQGISTLLMNTVINPTPEMLADPDYASVAGSGATRGQYIFLVGAGMLLTVLTGGGFLTALFPLIFIGILIVLGVVVALIIRQLMILLLVVISPLAFVAWLLPNTERQFSRWGSSLFGLLAMYPIIVLIFALGKVLGQFFSINRVDLTAFIPAQMLAGVFQLFGMAPAAALDQKDQVIAIALQFLFNAGPLVLVVILIISSNKIFGMFYKGVVKGGQRAGAPAGKALGTLRRSIANNKYVGAGSSSRVGRGVGRVLTGTVGWRGGERQAGLGAERREERGKAKATLLSYKAYDASRLTPQDIQSIKPQDMPTTLSAGTIRTIMTGSDPALIRALTDLVDAARQSPEARGKIKIEQIAAINTTPVNPTVAAAVAVIPPSRPGGPNLPQWL